MQKPVRLSIASAAFQDLERLEGFLLAQEDPLAGSLLAFVMEALALLKHQPGIGRPVEAGQRELIIERGRSGYLARYDYQRSLQHVTILRLRHQRESGYTPEET